MAIARNTVKRSQGPAGGSHQIAAIARPRGRAQPRIQGSLGPQLLLVLSLSQPTIGSLMPSQSRATINTSPAIQEGRPAADV